MDAYVRIGRVPLNLQTCPISGLGACRPNRVSDNVGTRTLFTWRSVRLLRALPRQFARSPKRGWFKGQRGAEGYATVNWGLRLLAFLSEKLLQ